MTLDTVKSFSEFSKLGTTRVYELTRAKGFPIVRSSEKGKILIKREDAIDWMAKKFGR